MTVSLFNILQFLFIIVFLWGIRLINSPGTAVQGNALGALGMLGAIAITLLSNGIISDGILWLSLAGGGVIGYFLAIKVSMIQIPQLVALLNGLGGGASAITALVVLFTSAGISATTTFTGGCALMVGGVTFSGSMIAAAKLDQKINQKPVVVYGHTFLTAAGMLLMCIIVVLMALSSGSVLKLLSVFTLVNALFFGILLTIRIGGADMPVTISLLNSLSGLAGSIAGFVISNPLLVAVGAIVGSAGLILTRIMCHAMNRTLLDVIMVKTTSDIQLTASDNPKAVLPEKNGTELSVIDEKPDAGEKIISILSEAKDVVIVPGYGMALSQAQSQVKELFEKLREHGKDVKFAIHPVAGRMPGHMNVLLAEVDVPYDRLYEMDAVNPEFKEKDVVIVVGANDVINTAAITAEGTPIYGMPILNVHEAHHVIVCNLDTKPGYAGVNNPLYEQDNVILVLGDAKETVGRLVEKVGK